MYSVDVTGGASIMVIEGGGEGGGGGGEGGVLAVVQGRAFCVEVRLQTADAGETVTSKEETNRAKKSGKKQIQPDQTIALSVEWMKPPLMSAMQRSTHTHKHTHTHTHTQTSYC